VSQMGVRAGDINRHLFQRGHVPMPLAQADLLAVSRSRDSIGSFWFLLRLDGRAVIDGEYIKVS
jgi:hypothetical protein